MSKDTNDGKTGKPRFRASQTTDRKGKAEANLSSEEIWGDKPKSEGDLPNLAASGQRVSGSLPGESGKPDEAAPGDQAEDISASLSGGTGVSKGRRKKKGRKGFSFFSGLRTALVSLPRWKIPVIPLAVLGVPFLIWFWGTAHRSGAVSGAREANRAAEMDGLQLPPEVSAQLDAALMNLRDGDTATAEKDLLQLDEGKAKYPSLSYLAALAAMQNGNIDLAERKVKESIIKRERISDALALQSVIETQKAADQSRWKTMGDPQKRSEMLLRQAILADAANPYPHFELATLLRYQGRRDEAAQELRAAKARLNPVDSHLLLDITLSLMRIEDMPEEQIPGDPPQSDDIRKLFPAAYASMRLGNFSEAAALLQRCRESLSIDVFDYLLNDPVVRKFSDREELKQFYKY